MNHLDIQAGAKHLRAPTQNLTPLQIDEYTDYLVRFTQELVDNTVPWSKPSSYAQPWWNDKVQKAVSDEREARRQQNWEKQKEARDRKGRTIRWVKRKCFREIISKATEGKGI